MVWRTFKNIVVEKLEQHNLSNFSVSSDDLATSATGTTFDARCLMYLKKFVRECNLLYEPKLTLAIPAGNPQVLDLSSNTVITTGENVYEVTGLWLDGIKIRCASMMEFSDSDYVTADAGFPSAYHQMEQFKVWFDRPLGDQYADSYVSGYVEHVSLTSDSASEGATTTILIHENFVDEAASYCAAKFMPSVVIDSGGALQLSNIEEKAAEYVMKIKAKLRVQKTPYLTRGR